MNNEHRLFASRLIDDLYKVEWVRASGGKHYICPFCKAISDRDGGPGHLDDCEFILIGRIFDELYPSVKKDK